MQGPGANFEGKGANHRSGPYVQENKSPSSQFRAAQNAHARKSVEAKAPSPSCLHSPHNLLVYTIYDWLHLCPEIPADHSHSDKYQLLQLPDNFLTGNPG